MLDNPEFIRLARSKLRPQRVALVGGIGAVVCGGLLALLYAGESGWGRYPVPNLPAMFRSYFFWIAGIQLFAVSLLGLILASQNIVLERERSTLDFQRLVGMGPWQLALGKLLGAPAEAYLLALVGTFFAGISVMGGGISLNHFAQSQVCVFVFAVQVAAFGLLCSAVVEKTSNASGMGVLISIGYLVISLMSFRAGTTVLTVADPILFLGTLYQASNPVAGFARVSTTFDMFGVPIPNLLGYCVVNLLLTWICFAATVRRLSSDEFSYIGLKHAVIGFVLVQVILVGTVMSVLGYNGFLVFHGVNAALLLTLAFGLSPSAELFRGRLYRARPNQHWGVILEFTNRLQDASPIAPLLAFALAYAVLSVILSFATNHAHIATLLAVLLNCGLAAAAVSLLVYLHVYMEKGSFKAGIGLLIGALLFPPLAVGVTMSVSHTLLISPFMYILALADMSDAPTFARNFRDVELSTAEWSCPLICAALGVLSLILVAMRIRYLLDVHEKQRAEEAAADQKLKVAPNVAAARLLAAPAAPQAVTPQPQADANAAPTAQ